MISCLMFCAIITVVLSYYNCRTTLSCHLKAYLIVFVEVVLNILNRNVNRVELRLVYERLQFIQPKSPVRLLFKKYNLSSYLWDK